MRVSPSMATGRVERPLCYRGKLGNREREITNYEKRMVLVRTSVVAARRAHPNVDPSLDQPQLPDIPKDAPEMASSARHMVLSVFRKGSQYPCGLRRCRPFAFLRWRAEHG